MDHQQLINNLANEYEEMPETERILLINIKLPDNKKTEFLLYLLCLNCQNHIKVIDADKHSLNCILPTDSVRKLDRQTDIEQIKYKLFKLKSLFERTIKERESKNADVLTLKTMMELAQKVCEQGQYYCDQLSIERLSVIINKVDGDTWMKLLAERLYSLLAQLENFDEDCKAEEISFEDQATKYDNEIRELKEKVYVYKRRSIILQNICMKSQDSGSLFHPLESIDSRMNSPNPTLLSSTSPCDSPEPRSSSFCDLGYNSETELRKYFYSLYLSQKLRLLSQKKKNFFFSINKLYTHVLFKQIPPENWQNFIADQLQNPNPEFLEPPVRRIYKFKRRQNFESIIEEDSGTE